ncbi:uncharacterized protein TrAFT101_009032 [Trichoderma asperellum]|nr:hypothetical protein TrAFT101_009032 [Trichoderma asperellum]
MNQRAILDKLPVAREAAFNSIPEAQESTCLAGTRVDILHRISEWANDFNTKPIFWLSGMAGTGKSTISRTIAQSFAGHLGASFFFKRGDADRGTASKIFTTIAADLLIREPALAPYIKQAIDNDPAVPWKGLQEQFDQLISQPLLKFVADGGKFDSVIIIIDALDECERESQIKSIIGLLSHLKIREGLCLRTFVTSRPELPVRLGFHAIEHKNLILHEIPQIIIKQDISLFLEYKIAEIREKFNASVSKDRQLPLGWPGESSFQSLVNMAVPLFIFAATVSRFIADRRGGDPDEKLKDILLYESRSQESRLDATYMPVLSNIISGLSTREREKTTQQFQNIIGSVITLASPLSSLALSQILNVSKRIIDNQLDLLHSVLRVPSSPESPIRLLHISFRDFLTDPDKEGRSPFWIDEKQAHARMAINCLNVMGKHLKCCICGIRDLGMPRSEIQPAKIEACLPPEAQYACLYWTYHLRKAEKYINANEKIYNFLICHFLHWIEALSLMGRTHESLGLINELLPIRDPISNLELVYFLNDAIRFIRRNITAIEETPLQLYSSLLVFAPRDSVIKNTFKGHISWIAREPETEMEIWNQHLQTLEGHSDGIKAVVFSHNSSLLASASHDGTVRIWNTNTGECLQELQVDTTAVQSVIFLEGSTRVASVSKNMTICIHEVETGRCIQQLKGYHKIHQAAIAVYNSTLLVSAASNDMVRIWDINAKKCLQVLRSHSKDVFSLAISTDLKLLVSMSNDKTAFIWDIDSKKPMKRFQANGAMAFSRDSKYIVAGCIDNSVGVWPVIHGNILHKFKGHTGQITAVTFSDDSKLVASASVDRTVKIWHVEQGVCIQEMQNYSRWVSSITFSHDSAILALASDDSTVRIWNIEGNQEIEESPGQWGPVMLIVPSPDSTLVASLHSAERAVRMWHVDDGECMDEIVSHDWVDSANFSLDSAFIATRSVDQTAHIWRTDSGECVYEFLSCSAWLESVSFSHDSTLVASASIDGCVVQILNVKEHKQIQTLHGHTGMIRSITFSHDSALMLTASEDKTARIWHIESGLCLQELQGHTCEITFAVFSYDSALATSTSSDKLRIWDVQSGSCLQEFPGHANDPKIAAFSHDSALLAVSYQDNTVRIWQIHTGNCLLEIDLGATTTRLSFSTSLSLLATDVGAINLQYLTQQSSHKDEHYSAICGYGISKDRSWITWNGKNTLWLPPEYRPSCSTVLGSTVMFGTYSGSVISFRFPDDPES